MKYSVPLTLNPDEVLAITALTTLAMILIWKSSIPLTFLRAYLKDVASILSIYLGIKSIKGESATLFKASTVSDSVYGLILSKQFISISFNVFGS